MILAFIIIVMLIGLVAIGNTEYKGSTKPAVLLDSPTTVSIQSTKSTPRRTSRRSSQARSRGTREQRIDALSQSTNGNTGFIELPEEAYVYQGLDLGGMPMYDNSVSDDRFLNDPDDGMSKDSTGFDEEY